MKKLFTLILMLALIVPSVAFATAETLTGTRGGSGFPAFGRGQAGDMKIAHGQYALTANVEDGDIFELCVIPPGATIVGGRFYAYDIDAGVETLDMDVGWAANGTEAADPDGLLNAGVLTGDAVTGVKPETGTSMPLGGVLITAGKASFTERTTIQVEANAAANSFSAGTIGVVIFYTMD